MTINPKQWTQKDMLAKGGIKTFRDKKAAQPFIVNYKHLVRLVLTLSDQFIGPLRLLPSNKKK